MNASIVVYSLLLASLLSAAQVLFKLFAMKRGADAGLHLSQFVPLAGALALYFLVFVLYAQALKKMELSLLYPTYTALSVLFTYAGGVLLFREQVSIRAFLGCMLLIVAVYLIAQPTQQQ